VEFLGYSLYDTGAYPEPPLSGKITWRVTQPWGGSIDDKEFEALEKLKQLIEQRLKEKQKKESG